MREVSLHALIPNYGGQVFRDFEVSRAQAEREGLLHSVTYASDSLVSRVRNVLTARFLDGACTHMMFLDSDLVFTPDHIRFITEELQKGAEVIGGLYPLKQRSLAWCINEMPDQQPNADGVLRVKYVGTGFLAVARSVLYRMAAAYPEIEYHTDSNEGINATNFGALRTLHDFWSVGVYKRRYLSEDWYFCQRCEDLGIPVFAHTKVKLGHIGLITYPIDNGCETKATA